MDRRSFFRKGIQKLGRSVVEEAGRRVDKRASRWIRPPYAIDELEFLITCTRCHACIEACPDQVIFSLSARCGATAAGTPALDLLNRACQLCDSWPCVAACEKSALRFPERDDETLPLPLPELATASINSDYCLPYKGPECGACSGICPQPGALLWDGPRPTIDASQCVGCALCRAACIADPKAISIQSRGQKDNT